MKELLFKNANIYYNNCFIQADMLVKNGVVIDISTGIFTNENTAIVDCDNYYILPGFADVHVHLREPGFLYKETIKTGTMAAAKGGFTLVCSMPNTNPIPDSVENINIQQQAIDNDSLITVLPYASITKGERGQEIVDMQALQNKCFAFSDDGKGVQSDDIMLKAMQKAKSLNKAIVAHCEDESLLEGGYIHKGEYAKQNGHKGISSESEYLQVKRDLELVRATDVQYHICHISTKETVELVRKAKKEGLNVSCETAPHYLAFCDMDLEDDGRFKMNPPIRSAEDRDALIKGVIDGTIEMIATDHAPHSKEEKAKGLKGSNMGVVGIETSFAAVNTYLVKKNHINLEKLVEIMSINPRKKFNLPHGIKIGEKADITLVDIDKLQIVNPQTFLSMGKATPFDGVELNGDVLLTIANGKIAYNKILSEK